MYTLIILFLVFNILINFIGVIYFIITAQMLRKCKKITDYTFNQILEEMEDA